MVDRLEYFAVLLPALELIADGACFVEESLLAGRVFCVPLVPYDSMISGIAGGRSRTQPYLEILNFQ